MGAAATAAALVLTGCAGGGGPAASAAEPTTHFRAGGVDVSMTVTGWGGSDGTLTIRFTPLKPTYHLYSIALPADGVDGVGRPTAVALRGALAATGRLTTTAPLHPLTLPGVSEPLEVYPDGPLTATLPLHRGAGNGTEATALVSYAACSETYGCQIPVANHPTALTLTGSSLSFTPSA